MWKRLGWIGKEERVNVARRKKGEVEKMGKRIVAVVALAALGLFLSLGRVEAAYQWSDDFESYSTGTYSPDGWYNSGAGIDNWVTNVSVSGTGSQSLYFTATTDWRKVSNDGPDYTFVTNQYLKIDLWAQSPTTNAHWEPSYIHGSGGVLARYVFESDGVIKAKNVSAISYTADTPYHFQMNLYPSNYLGGASDAWVTYNIYDAEGVELYSTNLSWENEGTDVQSYVIYNGSTAGGSAGYVDDVSMQAIPEPGTLLLFAGGMLSLILIRRRRKG